MATAAGAGSPHDGSPARAAHGCRRPPYVAVLGALAALWIVACRVVVHVHDRVDVGASLRPIAEHGGLRATATYVAPGSSTASGSSYGYMRFGDTDYFKTVITRDFARLTVYSTGFTDIVARLEDGLGRLVDVDDDSGPGGTSALLRW